MNQFEVPKSALFKGEATLPVALRGHLFARRQWLIEKHYFNSEYALGVSFQDRFLRAGSPMLQYQFFRGEALFPELRLESGADCWWLMESGHSLNPDRSKVRFVLYFRDWLFDKAADTVDLWSMDTNPWLDRYLEFAPIEPFAV
jgi:hypothetical protein